MTQQQPGTAVTTTEKGGAPASWESSGVPLEVVGMARALYASKLFKGVDSVAAAIVKIQMGNQLGITAVEALQYLHIFESKGRTSIQLGYVLVGSLIQRSGKYRYETMRNDDKGASIDFYRVRADGSEAKLGTSVFTYDQAQRAGLATKDVWQSYPATMLFARAMSQGARKFCPEVLGGASIGVDEPYIEGTAVIASPEGVVARDVTPRDVPMEHRPQNPPPEDIIEGEHREVDDQIIIEGEPVYVTGKPILPDEPPPVTITGDDEPPPDPYKRLWAKMREWFPDTTEEERHAWLHKLVKVPNAKGALADFNRQKAIKEGKTVPQLVAELLVRVEEVVARAAKVPVEPSPLDTPIAAPEPRTNPLVEAAKRQATKAKAPAKEVIDGKEVELSADELANVYGLDDEEFA